MFSYTATKNGSTVLSEDSNALPVSPLKQVTFQSSTDSPFPLKKTLISKNQKAGEAARKASIISLSELKLLRYKLAVALGICCIIMLFLLPIIFYYVEGSSEVSGRLSIIKDIGNVNISQVHTYVCSYVYVCMCVCMYVRMYVRMYVCMYVCMYIRMYVCMLYVCI